MRSLLCALAFLVVAPVAIAVGQPPGLQVHFTWNGTAACGHDSPPFVVQSVPAGTVALRFTMHDLQAPKYPHGGGTVRYTGSPEIPEGAFRYNGPCPPPGAHHVYRWTVQALAADSKLLAQQTVELPFPPG